ncbi:hypothetical protein CAPTEDRAFT_143813 [Capitella teleta]|uniref:GTPase-activating Rap/Ran-GAP domain-like protein 3 n=1 Tax=Capitella teleta TaxID=283909 RepID=R7TEL0_CAPTE|nr:hypothetical protein CAPTEDRAFT_143813 [Capitella teleta]|eukprot:ELT91917.1 hypothetical protein CAPTEDRAFT_143813 [Capitella teleta]
MNWCSLCFSVLFSSPASDLAARRGVFSRRHYGSVELLISTDNDGHPQNAGRFRVESGEREQDEVSADKCTNYSIPLHAPVHLENPEFQTRWYFKYFLGKLHQNYVGGDLEKEPFFVSVVVTDANNHSVHQYRAILWRKTGNQKICLPYTPNKPLTVKSILSTFGLEKVDKGPKEIFNPDVQKELLVLEEQEGSVNFKFGVIFAKEGQVSDDEMYSNEHGTEYFEKFNNLLGDRIRLKGWEKFKGGLDNKSDTTGKEAVHTVYEGHEVIFHISTMLPFTPDNSQQVERKRHVGNDIVNIIFYEVDGDNLPAFRPSMMKTHFTHIYAVVAYNKQNDTYRIAVFSEESVPLFGPALPCPPLFTNHQEFRDFLLVKLINGEKAAFNVPVFAQKRQRTLEMLIKNMYQDYIPDTAKNNMLNRRAFSDLIPENVHGPRRKEEARQLEFLRVGQSLKLKIILRGDAPTSLASSGALLKHQPWEPQCFLHELQHDVICGDSWGDKLIVVTSGGTLLLEGARPRVLFDRSVVIKQLTVVEQHGIIIFRADKGRESRIHIYRLSDFEGEKNEAMTRTKADVKDHKIERTKGCHMYSVSRAGSTHLRLIVAASKRLMVFVWRHSSAWSVWYPLSDNDVIDGFQFIRELQSFEMPHLMSLVDGCQEQDNQICVGYKNQFDLINEKNGDTLQLHVFDSSKANLVAALDIYEDDEAELLLCYNRMFRFRLYVSHFQKLREDNSQEFDFYWNSEPKGVVCAFPYIMAFTPDTIEIRLIINGNLVHTMSMPDLQLITSKVDDPSSGRWPSSNDRRPFDISV